MAVNHTAQYPGLEVDRTKEGLQPKYPFPQVEDGDPSIEPAGQNGVTRSAPSRGRRWKTPWGLRPLTCGILIAVIMTVIVGGVVGGAVGGSLAQKHSKMYV